MEVKNCMEKFVIDNIDGVLGKYPGVCGCEKCRRDICILALNHLPPKYVATDKGDTYTRLTLCTQEHMMAIVQELAKAIEIVSHNPRHEEN